MDERTAPGRRQPRTAESILQREHSALQADPAVLLEMEQSQPRTPIRRGGGVGALRQQPQQTAVAGPETVADLQFSLLRSVLPVVGGALAALAVGYGIYKLIGYARSAGAKAAAPLPEDIQKLMAMVAEQKVGGAMA